MKAFGAVSPGMVRMRQRIVRTQYLTAERAEDAEKTSVFDRENSSAASANSAVNFPGRGAEIGGWRNSGGAVQVGWGWGGHSTELDMIRLEVDRGGGQGFVLLATDTTPNYTDTQTLPSTPAKWTYRWMYYVGD